LKSSFHSQNGEGKMAGSRWLISGLLAILLTIMSVSLTAATLTLEQHNSYDTQMLDGTIPEPALAAPEVAPVTWLLSDVRNPVTDSLAADFRATNFRLLLYEKQLG
jgi:hypothetical protein